MPTTATDVQDHFSEVFGNKRGARRPDELEELDIPVSAQPGKTIVTFKEESVRSDGATIGAICVIDEEKRAADPKARGMSVPRGYKPEWRKERGWGTRVEAKALAVRLGAELRVR